MVTKKDFVAYWQQNIKYITRKNNTLNLATQKTPLPVDYTQKELANLFEIFVNTLEDILKEGENISFSGFGTFRTVLRKEFISRNPATGEKMYNPPKMVVKFHMSNKFKNKISDELTYYLNSEGDND